MPLTARRRLLLQTSFLGLGSSLAPPLLAEKSAHGTLNLGGEAVAPYSFLLQGEAAGLHVELCREALGRLELPMQWAPMPWRRALSDLDAGVLDGVMGATRGNLNERELQMAFPEEPLSWTHSVFVSSKSRPVTFDGLFSLRGLRVAVLAGYGYSPDFMAAPYFERQQAVSHEQSLRLLFAGRVQVALMDVAAVRYLVQRDGLGQRVHIDPTPMAPGRLYLGLSRQRGQAQWAEPLSEALRAIKRSSTYPALLSRYGLRQEDVEQAR